MKTPGLLGKYGWFI